MTGLNGTVMDSIYSELTSDASTNRNREMDQRIQLAMQGEPGIIVDLWKMNKGRLRETFQNFFSVMEEVVNEVKILYTIINKICLYIIYINIIPCQLFTIKSVNVCKLIGNSKYSTKYIILIRLLLLMKDDMVWLTYLNGCPWQI